MKNQILILSLLIMGVTSCSAPKMDEEQITKVLIVDEGIIGGVNLNDSWEDVKKLNPDFWEVHESDGDWSLRKNLDMFNRLSLSFSLTPDKKVKEIHFNIDGRGENRVVIASIYNKLFKSFEAKFDKEDSENWKSQIKNHEASIHLSKGSHDGGESLYITSYAMLMGGNP